MSIIRKFFGCIVLIVGISSCSSDEKEYSPEVSKGDFVLVKEMRVRSFTLSGEIEDKYQIDYNNVLNPKKISLVIGGDGNEPLVYDYKYTNQQLIDHIEVKRGGSSIDEIKANYENNELKSLKGIFGVSDFVYNKGNVVQAARDQRMVSYIYNYLGNLNSFVTEKNEQWDFEYGNGKNPFTNSRFNLTFRYLIGADLIELVQSSKNNITKMTNVNTKEDYTISYEWDQFGYPIKMIVRKDGIVLKEMDYEYGIFRKNISN